jgi:ribosomal-protein-alanine N-acetyltransferase
MLNTNFNPFPQLSTDRLRLRQVNKEDANEIFILRSDERVMKFIDRPRAKSIDDALQLIQKINDALSNNDGINWAITLKSDLKLIGTIGYWRIIKENYRAEIGYLLHPDYHKKGIMQEVFTTVIDYGFTTMKLHSIEANVNPDNAASIKLLERNKFTREAYMKENLFYDGKFLDSAIYSLLNPVE